MAVEVLTKDLRAALAAVVPFLVADRDPFDKVRFEVHPAGVLVSATNGVAVCVAQIPADLWEDDTTGSDVGTVFDVAAVHAKKLLAVHQVVRRPAGDALDVEQKLMLELIEASTALRTQDVSGLFPGQEALIVPVAAPSAVHVDVPGLVGAYLAEHDTTTRTARGVGYDGRPLAVSFAVFDAAVKAFKAPMAVRFTKGNRYAIVTVGEHVVGSVITHDVADQCSDGDQVVLDAWGTWRGLLPDGTRLDLDVIDPDSDSAPDSGPALQPTT